ncbi:MAG: tRNA (N6-isopentenyl adenosine(37)-C2)-methylthiotransferase MiaB [Magnetococcales bacterium]|nr:tRNA (N6-isopentenyl adenosine(37)-C2)-methylthiotransferase MiaB [Magnetococcales bacterium]MBF0148626.1 tRNA (N6-isopentenyl adenosine(37)-C2)-methylthiotransferase MiaB [Magnetococcales bacterium]MBF0346873.1 tRNA (N6-isopentenyl adenosine(37)-C2)-methylthiotransferase MiaB [Magnetococcales bacterium]MBF0630868.1 tRNA (N6-isopentenyl adenosine(37)-C2)-methylthiotransferase MiaB [Magnetococcales bacterium]
MKNLFIKNFGCQMNLYDAGRITDLLAKSHGLTLVSTPEAADLIVFNTCHIREKAEEKLFSELGRMRKLVQQRAQGDDGDVVFAVGGCVGQAEGMEIFRRAPFVDVVFGPQNYHELPQMLDRLAQRQQKICATSTHATDKFDHLPATGQSGPIAMVTIQEGCNRYCSYCVVPHTRGPEWSRPVADVLDEIAVCLSQGAVEIQLLGQNVTTYKAMDSDGTIHDLALLIRRVALLEGVRRIRFITSHPADMNDDLVELFAELPELCPYMHLPIQSGSDAILRAMERGHTVADYRQWAEKLRRVHPEMALASDFIVAFPGETEQDFQATLALIEELRFDHAYSFLFSSRPGTKAASMVPAVPLAVGQQRLADLQDTLNRIQLENNRQQVGKREEILVEKQSRTGQGLLSGRTRGNRWVNIPGPREWIGRLLEVEIVEGFPNSLKGCVLPERVV